MRDAREDLRDVILTLLMPPVGLLFVGRCLVVRGRRPRDAAHWVLTVVLLVLGLWLTMVLLGLTIFSGYTVRTA